ncbi:hypothetical protein LOK49_Contig12G00007 [Camellia lanceoleosa]|nr:hypothetical protein LOK49_Contig12G00007 [Camellia lanceoleosa]
MDKANFSFCFITFLLCIVACTCSMDSNTWAEQNKQLILTWCVTNPSTTEANLQRAIVVYCHQVGVDCSVIKRGGSCYLPNTVIDHASVVLNLYYTANNKNNSFCPDFANITTNNPSHGSCKFP